MTEYEDTEPCYKDGLERAAQVGDWGKMDEFSRGVQVTCENLDKLLRREAEKC